MGQSSSKVKVRAFSLSHQARPFFLLTPPSAQVSTNPPTSSGWDTLWISSLPFSLLFPSNSSQPNNKTICAAQASPGPADFTSFPRYTKNHTQGRFPPCPPPPEDPYSQIVTAPPITSHSTAITSWVPSPWDTPATSTTCTTGQVPRSQKIRPADSTIAQTVS